MNWRLLTAVVATAALAVPPVAAQVNGTFDCLLEPRMVVAVGAAVDGLIESMTLDRGDLVKQGDVLAQLEASGERAAVAAGPPRAPIQAPQKGHVARLDFRGPPFGGTVGLYKKEGGPFKGVDGAAD